MSYGPIAVYTVTMASGGTLTSEVNLSRSWKTVHLEIPTMTSNSELRLQAANASGGTYRVVYHPPINSATVAVNILKINSSITNAIVEIPNGLQFMKVESTATVDNGCIFKIICSD